MDGLNNVFLLQSYDSIQFSFVSFRPTAQRETTLKKVAAYSCVYFARLGTSFFKYNLQSSGVSEQFTSIVIFGNCTRNCVH